MLRRLSNLNGSFTSTYRNVESSPLYSSECSVGTVSR